MTQQTRRHFIAAGAAAVATVAARHAHAGEARKLTRTSSAQDHLASILMNRRSVREFDRRPVEDEKLAGLLWSANGINRPETGGRTAPSWHTSYGSDVLVCDGGGVWHYDAKAEELHPKSSGDIRNIVSTQPFVKTAPIVLLHITDLERMYKAPDDQRIRFAYVDSAIVAQNIYLYCAASGLGTCLVGGVDAKAVSSALSLTDKQLVTYAQPIGYPKAA